MRIVMLLFSLSIVFISFSQNTGIGTTSPTEKLDVNGNINVTGTIKANGVDGTSGQVLMKNSSNVMTWANICDYKNMVTFLDTSGILGWNVPAGVTKIWIEMWGGGGAGHAAGGGGGCYISFFREVSAGMFLSIEVGKGGKDQIVSGIAQAGTYSRVSSGSANINIFAHGGGGASSSISSYVQDLAGTGGSYYIFPGSAQDGFFAIAGQTGKPLRSEYYLIPGNQYNQVEIFGDGGNAGNTSDTGGSGGIRTRNNNASVFTTLAVSPARFSGFPGGGGGGSADGLINTYRAGSNGMVIIHY